MVASRGQIPKRSEVRRRTNAPADGLEILDAPGMPAEPREPAEYWCPIARETYDSVCSSGQSVYFEQSDYAVLWLACDQIHALYNPQYLGMMGTGVGTTTAYYARRPMLSGELSAIMKTLGSLGATEGDRRRMRIELQKVNGDGPRELPAGVVAFSRARKGRRPKNQETPS